MRTHPVEAGTRLAGRFVLIDALASAPASSDPEQLHPSPAGPPAAPVEQVAPEPEFRAQWWRAHDEILARTVAVRLVAPGPKAARELAAARTAARVTDPRVVRVLDVGTTDDVSYVVTEWCDGDDLATALQASGPVAASVARRLAVLTAQALASAEDVGLPVPQLGPRDVRLLADGGLRIAGLERPAGPAGADPAHAGSSWGARISGAVLYATLTGRWPLALCDGLPAAPTESGVVCAPRQVRAGLPADLDAIAVAALGLHGRHAPLTTAAAVAEALAPGSLEVTSGGYADDADDARDSSSATQTMVTDSREANDVVALLAAPPGPSRAARAVRAGAVTLLSVGVGLAVWQGIVLVRGVATNAFDGSQPARSRTSAPPKPATYAAVVPDVTSFDPPPRGNGDEHPDQVARVLDHDAASTWSSYTYTTPALGGQKDGVGLLLDLGRERQLSAVGLDVLPGEPGREPQGADLSLFAFHDRPTSDPAAGDAVARASGASGHVQLRPAAPVSARWVLVWFTRLPASRTGYQVQVAELTASVVTRA